MIQKKAFSLVDQIFERLENKILTGEIPRGEIITETKVAQELGVSRTPVKGALMRLVMDHMVEETPKGLMVVGISDEDAMIIYDIREKIEGMAAGIAAKNADDEQIAELREILELQEYYLERGNAEKIREQDSRFHEALYKACQSPVLSDTLTALHRKVQKYRKLAVSQKSRAVDSVGEHKQILEALENRDSAAAEAAVTLHIQNARKRICNLKGE